MKTVFYIALRNNVSADNAPHYSKLSMLSSHRNYKSSYRRNGKKDERKLYFLLSTKLLIGKRIVASREEKVGANKHFAQIQSVPCYRDKFQDRIPSGVSTYHIIEAYGSAFFVHESIFFSRGDGK